MGCSFFPCSKARILGGSGRHRATPVPDRDQATRRDIHRLEDNIDQRLDRLDSKLWMVLGAIVAGLACFAIKNAFQSHGSNAAQQ